MRALVAAAAAALTLGGSGRAAASPRNDTDDASAQLAAALVETDAHMHALRYVEARAAAEAALRLGAARRADVITLVRILGEIAASLDDTATAERWFLEWLTLEPSGDLPAGTSPKLTEPLAAVRARLKRPLDLRVDAAARQLIIVVTADPAPRIATIAITIDTPRSTEVVSVPPPTADRLYAHVDRDVPDLVTIQISVRDQDGNELAAETTTSHPGDPPYRRPARRLWRRPLPYAITAGIAAGLGGFFLWRRSIAKDDLATILANSDQFTFADAEAARHRAERHGWSAVASFAAAGALAATAIIMVTRSDEPERILAVAPTSGGALVLATTPF